MTPKATLAAVSAALLVLCSSSARAAHFDAIYVDEYDLALPACGGLTLSAGDFMLFVNKGTSDVGAPELFGTQFTVTTSVPDLQLTPYVNQFLPINYPAPVHPNEAVGGVGPQGDVLTPLLQPGETFRNTIYGDSSACQFPCTLQVFTFQVKRVGQYNGPVTATIEMQTGLEVASLVLHFNLTTGPREIAFKHGARTSSVPSPAATLPSRALRRRPEPLLPPPLARPTTQRASPASPVHFDAIYVDEYDLTLPDCSELVLSSGNDFMWFVNKGTSDVEAPELFGTQFSVTTSVPDLQLTPFVNQPLADENLNPLPYPAPIHPDEAVGGLGQLGDVLTPSLLTGETYRNSAIGPPGFCGGAPCDLQVFAFQVGRVGLYNGPVTATVQMKTGLEVATLVMHFNLMTGPAEVAFKHGARASSGVPTRTQPTTWGRLKALYR